MATKYYLTTQGARGVQAGGKIFEFERVFYAAGTHYAIYAAASKEEQEPLDELVKSNRLQSISGEKYEDWIKKKLPSSNRRQAQVVEGAKPTPQKDPNHADRAEQAKPVEIIEEAKPSVEHTSEEGEATEPVAKKKKPAKKTKKPKED